MSAPNVNPLAPPSPPNTSFDTSVIDSSLDSTDVGQHDIPEVEVAHSFIDAQSLTSTDIRSDPILSSIAKHQSAGTSKMTGTSSSAFVGSSFRAKPAPATTNLAGVGPRMTKSAVLRQGLDWEGGRPPRETREVDLSSTPGHKRALNLNIASLAAPSVMPRATKASQLRTGGIVTPTAKRDLEAAAVANQAKAEQERERRRKSIALPASLSAPSIAPRANKASLLRTGGAAAGAKGPMSSASPTASSFSRNQTALRATDATNVPKEEPAKASGEKGNLNRRASMAAPPRSLGTPSITPRMNRASMLRTLPSNATISTSSPLPSVRIHSRPATAGQATTGSTTTSSVPAKPVAMTSARAALKAKSSAPSTGSAPSTTPKGAPAGPKPTKASLLRAKLGAKGFSRG